MKLNANLPRTSLALSALCALALSTASLQAGAAPKARDERGTIKSVDAANHTLVVTDLKGGAEHQFRWNDRTKFSEHGKSASAADLKAGERVRIHSTGSGDTLTMVHVNIAPAKPTKP
jgi:hypothetical protein